MMLCCRIFFFSSRRRHTRYWRDWSSDVCSSDLFRALGPSLALTVLVGMAVCLTLAPAVMTILSWRLFTVLPVRGSEQIGRASCRGRVEISVVAVSLKKKINNKHAQTDTCNIHNT